MRIIQTNCAIEYEGRCHTFLDYAVRLVMIKEDGCVLIINDKGVKPLNYMMNVKNTQEILDENNNHILIVTGRKETLRISMSEIIYDVYLPFTTDDDMKKTGTEDELQDHVFECLADYIPNATALCREFETGKGRVDVCGLSDDENHLLLIELKRKATRKDVYQVLRYADGVRMMFDELNAEHIHSIEIKGSHKQTDKMGRMVNIDVLKGPKLFLAASEFTGKTKEEAKEHGVTILDVSRAREAIKERYIAANAPDIPNMAAMERKLMGDETIGSPPGQ